MKRLFDIIFSIIILLLGLPFFIIISILILFDGDINIFFIQERIGKNKIPFKLYKFRSMKTNSEKNGQITIGAKDSRITNIGYYLRKYKIDEFPQLLNVLMGHMSIVGPRPEVDKYVKLYSNEQNQILSVKPGLTDLASISYFEENKLLGESDNPEETYINEVMPEKIKLSLEYIDNQSFINDIKIILSTIRRILQ
jgi:lipopolysaccharide/colanic/teichoic acid biosynthesis glycosyltransferase